MEQRLTREKTCPLLMIAKACRHAEELGPISPLCMGNKCAWFHEVYKWQEKGLTHGFCTFGDPRPGYYR